MTEENKNIYISRWLLLITFLVGSMILVGGLTRLTDSGLSITRWELFSGILPPFTQFDWEKAFFLYKKIPEYKLVNSSMTLEQFKVIYWWEYSHRLLGRFIGLLYFVPLIYFTWKKLIKRKFLITFYLIFLLILFQGVIGWYMVKSGLTDRTDVSHYRLCIHLTLAFIIFILLLWNYFKYVSKENFIRINKLPHSLLNFFMIMIIIQISVGALVSGLDAAQIYQSWPLMNEKYFPDDSNLNDLISFSAFETPSILQFIHRNLAYFIFFIFLYIFSIIFKNKNYYYLKKSALWVLISLLLQVFLGIITILSGAQIIIASMHQAGSIILVTTSLMLVYKNYVSKLQ